MLDGVECRELTVRVTVKTLSQTVVIAAVTVVVVVVVVLGVQVVQTQIAMIVLFINTRLARMERKSQAREMQNKVLSLLIVVLRYNVLAKMEFQSLLQSKLLLMAKAPLRKL